MADLQGGVVTAIDRANGVVRGVLDDGSPVVAEFFAACDREPWPLCNASFGESSSGRWICFGPIGSRRTILHDDFTRVTTTPNFGDTPWTYTSDGTGGAISAANSTDAQGSVNIHRNAGISGNEIIKTTDGVQGIPAGSSEAYWMVWRVMTPTLPSTWVGVTSSDCGLWNVSLAQGVGFSLGGSADVFTAVTLGGTSRVTGVPVVAGQFHVCEFILTHSAGVAGESAFAGWVDGDGPYVLEGGGTPSGFAPFAACGPVGTTDGAAGTVARDFVVDFVSLHLVNPTNDPSDYALN